MLPWLCELYAGECLAGMPSIFDGTAADVLPVSMMKAMVLWTQESIMGALLGTKLAEQRPLSISMAASRVGY